MLYNARDGERPPQEFSRLPHFAGRDQSADTGAGSSFSVQKQERRFLDDETEVAAPLRQKFRRAESSRAEGKIRADDDGLGRKTPD